MNDREDVLKRASGALRDTGTPSREDVERLRARLIGGGKVVHMARGRRRPRVQWALPLVAALLTATALAATPAAWESVLAAAARYLPFAVEARGPAKSVQRAPESPRAQPPSLQVARTPPEPAPPAPIHQAAASGVAPPELVAAPTGHAPQSRPHVPRAVRPRPPKALPGPLEPIPTAESTAPAPSATALPSREVQAFRTAYALQLRLRDPLRALAAWDALLQREPSASLAMEARFNRALCLVQLGRRDAARQALASFATGRETNEYRRREALALLRNLGVSP